MQISSCSNSSSSSKLAPKVGLLINLSLSSLQILIVQFFTTAFHVEGMDWQQWGWCLFLGFSELLWAQLVFTIPKKFVPVGLRCVSTGYPTGRGIAYLRSNSRVDQQVTISFYMPFSHGL